jgi:hypothetical protein
MAGEIAAGTAVIAAGHAFLAEHDRKEAAAKPIGAGFVKRLRKGSGGKRRSMRWHHKSGLARAVPSEETGDDKTLADDEKTAETEGREAETKGATATETAEEV